MLSFPQELLDFVFSHLSNHSLSACSAVCQNWRVSVRPLLFYTVVVRWGKVDDFISYLRSQSSTVTVGHVKELVFRGELTAQYPSTGRVTLTVSEIETILKMLPQVHSLSMDLVLVTCYRHNFGDWKIVPRPMKKICLSGVDLDTSRIPGNPPDSLISVCWTLAELLNLFSSVTVMHFCSVGTTRIRPNTWDTLIAAAHEAGQTISPSFSVKELILTGQREGSDLALEMLKNSPKGLSVLQSMEIDEYLVKERAIGPTINRLTIHLNTTGMRRSAPRIVCPKLFMHLAFSDLSRTSLPSTCRHTQNYRSFAYW